MELSHIIIRAFFAYTVVLFLCRGAGRRTVGQTDLTSFIVILIIGDMFDDLFWSEVAASQFIVGVTTLVVMHLWSEMVRTR